MGTIRRECLDHGIVFNEASLCRHLKSFLEYYHQSGTHWSLEKDTPESRSVQPPESGYVVAVPQVAGRIIGTNVEQREGEGREDYCHSTNVALCSDAQFSPSFSKRADSSSLAEPALSGPSAPVKYSPGRTTV